MTQPARLNFWRIILGIIPPLAFLSLWQLWVLAGKLQIASLGSKSWLAALGALALTGITGLFLLALTWSSNRERLLGRLEAGAQVTGLFRWLAVPILCVALTAYSLTLFHGYYTDLIRGQDWLRLFFFVLLALLGMNALKMLWPAFSWPAAFLTSILLQAAVYRIALYLPDISAYPFAMGWSETSRFYWPSLFMGQKIYGQSLPWPILHPSLHLALVPPYLFDAPLWFHRFWQVAVRFLLVGLVAPALLSRLKTKSSDETGSAHHLLRWLFGVWIFVYLFTLPLYLHLAVPVLIMLWGFSASNDRRTWIALVAASIWAGLSRLNWYPLPGVLAAVLYMLEIPSQGKGFWRYISKPAAWCIAGTAVAFAAQRLYIVLSGIPDAGNFYTSLSSSLLWSRLWPNPSYALGILPAIAIFSAPLWLVIGFSLWQHRSDWRSPAFFAGSGLRVGLMALALFMLFAGGVLVSMKIGGGADLHNMDAFAVLLMIVSAYLLFACYTPESGQSAAQVTFPWGMIALLVLVPAWFIVQAKASFWAYDPALSQATLTALQQRVDSLNTQGGEILFITQRHLISMRMLKGVKLIPEYEREELMEMAMAKNESYLKTLRSDLERHRFSAIIVDPLRINFVGDTDSMGAENDAWTRSVAKRILCTYQEDLTFPEDHIAVYVPQPGVAQCP